MIMLAADEIDDFELRNRNYNYYTCTPTSIYNSQSSQLCGIITGFVRLYVSWNDSAMTGNWVS